jgi:hypothetical protein
MRSRAPRPSSNEICRAVISGRARLTSSNQIGSLASGQVAYTQPASKLARPVCAVRNDNVNGQETSEP